MRHWIIGGLLAANMCAGIGRAQDIVRSGAAESPIAGSVTVPGNARLIYVSGTVPDAINPAAAAGSVERFGDTEAQTRSVLGKIDTALKAKGGYGLRGNDRVFLSAPPGAKAMYFAGMMRGYKVFFGTAAQPLKPARSTMQVSGLVDPGWLVEIEVTAARK